MALGFLNRCIWTATSTGTVDFVVSAAVIGYRTPAQAGAVNATTYNYWAWSDNYVEWEYGSAVYTVSGTVLDRIPIGSSNADALVNFTLAPKVSMGGPLASDGGRLNSKIITITRDLTAANGAVAYTGVGFKPTSLSAMGNVTPSLTQYTVLNAFADSDRNSNNIYLASSFGISATNFLTFFDSTGSNGQNAVVTSYDSDGFTLTWTKSTAPTGTATIYVKCLW